MTSNTPPGDPTIRRAAPDDAVLLAELAARLFRDTFAAENTAEDMALYEKTAFSEAAFRAELSRDDHAMLVVEDGHEPIGYAALIRGSKDEAVRADRPAEIQRFYVDRSRHGRGVAQSLMAACLEHADVWQCDVVWLGVWERNARAIAFYERQGFRRVGRKTFTLGRDVQHDYVMARPVTPPA